MSRNIETGAWSQTKMQKYSFNFKPEYHDLFIHLQSSLALLSGDEKVNKTQVMEWALTVAAQHLTDAERNAMKQYRMQNETQ
ncbi:MAG: hypothetical protein ACPG51_19930 [Thiolinea sp.]